MCFVPLRWPHAPLCPARCVALCVPPRLCPPSFCYLSCACCQTLHALVDPELYDARPGSTNHAHIIANLKSEAVLLTSLRHPNIVSFLGMIVTGVPRLPKYLVFEVARGTLGAHLAGLPAPPSMQDLIGYAKDILSALAYIHTPAPGREAIVHRDLKPDNVLVFPGPTASRPILKISDVGLARHFAGSLGMSIGGTMFYMAPEMCVALSACLCVLRLDVLVFTLGYACV